MPYLLLFAALAGFYLYERSKAAPVAAPTNARTEPTSNPLFSGPRNLSTAAQNAINTVGSTIDDIGAEANALGAMAKSLQGNPITDGIKALGNVMPGIFKDLGLDNTGSAKDRPATPATTAGGQATATGGADAPLTDDQAAALYDDVFGDGAYGGVMGNLGADSTLNPEVSSDLGVDTSTTQQGGYQDSMFPSVQGTAGTVSDSVTPDPATTTYDAFGVESNATPADQLSPPVLAGDVPAFPGVELGDAGDGY